MLLERSVVIIFIYNKNFNSQERLKQVNEYVSKYGEENIDIKLLTKMYDYVAEQIDKEEHEKERLKALNSIDKNKKSMQKIYTSYRRPKDTEGHIYFDVLKDLENGIKTNVRKTVSKSQDVKWALYDPELEAINAARAKSQNETIDIINENIKAYTALREYIDNNIDYLKYELAEVGNTTPHKLKMSINSDIAVCKNGLVLNNVNINTYNFSTFDKLSPIDIDYSNPAFIKECLRAYRFIENKASKDIDSFYACIYLDIKNVLQKDIYTDRQMEVISKVINAESLNKTTERNILEYTIKKIIKHLNGEC